MYNVRRSDWRLDEPPAGPSRNFHAMMHIVTSAIKWTHGIREHVQRRTRLARLFATGGACKTDRTRRMFVSRNWVFYSGEIKITRSREKTNWTYNVRRSVSDLEVVISYNNKKKKSKVCFCYYFSFSHMTIKKTLLFFIHYTKTCTIIKHHYTTCFAKFIAFAYPGLAYRVVMCLLARLLPIFR